MKLIINSQAVKDRACAHIQSLPLDKPKQVAITTADLRTLDQNAKMWPLLGDISKQVLWHGMKLTAEEWKDMFTASLKRQKAVPAIDGGGFVVVGTSTRKMGKKMFSDLLEVIQAFGAERQVNWSDSRREE